MDPSWGDDPFSICVWNVSEIAHESMKRKASEDSKGSGVFAGATIATILHRAVESFGRDVLFRMPPAEVRLPLSVERWEPQVRPLALEQLQRIVTNYCERHLPSESTGEGLARQT